MYTSKHCLRITYYDFKPDTYVTASPTLVSRIIKSQEKRKGEKGEIIMGHR